MRALAICVVLSVLSSVVACSAEQVGRSPEEVEAATDALASLEKIKAAIEVGVTFPTYTEMVAEAKYSVNVASQVLSPTDSVSLRLQSAIGAFADASSVWQAQIQGTDWISRSDSTWRVLFDRYGLTQQRPDAALQEIWAAGRKDLGYARFYIDHGG